jgi:hypothetical protein
MLEPVPMATTYAGAGASTPTLFVTPSTNDYIVIGFTSDEYSAQCPTGFTLETGFLSDQLVGCLGKVGSGISAATSYTLGGGTDYGSIGIIDVHGSTGTPVYGSWTAEAWQGATCATGTLTDCKTNTVTPTATGGILITMGLSVSATSIVAKTYYESDSQGTMLPIYACNSTISAFPCPTAGSGSSGTQPGGISLGINTADPTAALNTMTFGYGYTTATGGNDVLVKDFLLWFPN